MTLYIHRRGSGLIQHRAASPPLCEWIHGMCMCMCMCMGDALTQRQCSVCASLTSVPRCRAALYPVHRRAHLAGAAPALHFIEPGPEAWVPANRAHRCDVMHAWGAGRGACPTPPTPRPATPSHATPHHPTCVGHGVAWRGMRDISTVTYASTRQAHGL